MKLDLTRIELKIASFGLTLLGLSLFAFFFEMNRITGWLGLNGHEDGKIVAKAEVVKNNVRRRLRGSPEFQSIRTHQSIFNRDSLMTGSDSSVLLVFQDQKMVELGPETVVEIYIEQNKTTSSDLVFDVQKGKVTGSGDGIQLKEGGKVVALQPLSESSKDDLFSSLPEIPVPEKVMKPAPLPAVTQKPTETPSTPRPSLTPEKTPSPMQVKTSPPVSEPAKGAVLEPIEAARIFLLYPRARALLTPTDGIKKGLPVPFQFEVEPKGLPCVFELRHDGKLIISNLLPGNLDGKFELPILIHDSGLYLWQIRAGDRKSEVREVTIKYE